MVVNVIVGFGFTLQQTPFEVIVAPPSLEIVPPELADELVISEIIVVVICGLAGAVVNVYVMP